MTCLPNGLVFKRRPPGPVGFGLLNWEVSLFKMQGSGTSLRLFTELDEWPGLLWFHPEQKQVQVWPGVPVGVDDRRL